MAQGIIVIDQWEKLGHQRCKHWLFRVWDARNRRWKSKAFDGKAEGWRWAEAARAELNLGLATTGSLSFRQVAADYVRALTDRDLGAFHRREVEIVCTAVAEAGAEDLHSKEFSKTVSGWLAGAKTFAKGRSAPPSNVTKNRWLRHLKSACIHAVRVFKLRANPLDDIKPLKVSKKIKPTLKIDELRAAVADAGRSHPYFLAACLMIYAGLRSGEALFCKWEWFDFEARTITLRTTREYPIKGNKERIVPMLDELREILLTWPGRRPTGYVVEEPRYRALENKGRWLAFRAYLKSSGVDPRDLHPHATRHTWAAVMLATGLSQSRVKDAFGHGSMKTTGDYSLAEAAYENVVRGWTRGQMFLRRPAPADAIEDPLAFLREHMQGGGTVEQLAAASGVPIAVLTTWLHQGPPEAVRQLIAARHAARRITDQSAGRRSTALAMSAETPGAEAADQSWQASRDGHGALQEPSLN